MTDGVAMSKGKAVGRDMDMDKVKVMVKVMVSTWENGGHALLSPSHSQTHPDSPKGPLMQITCTLHHCNSSAVLRLLQVLVRRLRVWNMYPTSTYTSVHRRRPPKAMSCCPWRASPSASSHASLHDSNTLLQRAPFNLHLLSTMERHHPVACNHH
ncbi:hypothetical protein H0G86_002153 [Trichoderma simmonsii]|uniref:Uncharacterized protein n=1 Tax=Trichoderma simmonsii TaxID=1491479 RepID=A0A8G0PBW4_9HYPO|nr:hypothetical protein H0G86_002153 [Trichoderma simmonsii]